jgi:hypothetical protein
VTRRRVWIGAGTAALLLAVAALVFGVLSAGEGGTALARGRAISATARIDPTTPLFGDEITARIDVVVDRRRADPSKVHVRTRFTPLEPVTQTTRRWDVGRLTYIRKTWTLRCLSRLCAQIEPTFSAGLNGAKGTGRRATPLAPARIVYAARGLPSLTLAWPTVEWLSRINQTAESSGSFFYHVDLVPPPVSYAISPGRLLILLAVVLVVVLAILAAIVRRRLAERRRARLPHREPELPPLERALRLLEHALGDDGAGRRRALELVAVEVERAGERALSTELRALAWQPAVPPADEAEQIGARIRSTMASNGAAPA